MLVAKNQYEGNPCSRIGWLRISSNSQSQIYSERRGANKKETSAADAGSPFRGNNGKGLLPREQSKQVSDRDIGEGV
jgi:hypothetical protein